MSKEWKWEKIKAVNRQPEVLDCPFCNIRISTLPFNSLLNTELGVYRCHVHHCVECGMPLILGINKKILFPPQRLPFNPVGFLPHQIESLYNECRKTLGNQCFLSSIILARTAIMYVAVDLGAHEKERFIYYINYLEREGHIAPRARAWVDQIREIGNKTIHEIVEVTDEEANLVLKFLMHLLIQIYELPNDVR